MFAVRLPRSPGTPADSKFGFVLTRVEELFAVGAGRLSDLRRHSRTAIPGSVFSDKAHRRLRLDFFVPEVLARLVDLLLDDVRRVDREPVRFELRPRDAELSESFFVAPRVEPEEDRRVEATVEFGEESFSRGGFERADFDGIFHDLLLAEVRTLQARSVPNTLARGILEFFSKRSPRRSERAGRVVWNLARRIR